VDNNTGSKEDKYKLSKKVKMRGWECNSGWWENSKRLALF
jgi:hypothetical protein